MHVKYLQCSECKKRYDKRSIVYKCECGGSIEVIYNYDEIKDKISWDELRKRPFNHWRYREFFPLIELKNIVSLEEGGTPIIKSKIQSSLLLKCENLNPTGSFKDRGSALEVSKAREFKAKEVVCASTGNMGASVAAYCSRGGIKATIFVPDATLKNKIKQIRAYGADIRIVKGDYTKAMNMAKSAYEKDGIYLMGDYAYRGEGEKSVGFEIMDQTCPDYIISPIGNGTLIHGMWKGIKELKLVGLINRLPRLIGVQAKGCNTVVKAFNNDLNYIEPVLPKTKADAIACGDPLDGMNALKALRESEGIGIAVSDKEIKAARKELAREGIFAELSGAASLAGFKKLSGELKDFKMLLLVTGHGLKDI